MVVDLLVGSDIGTALLREIDRSHVRSVVTCEQEIAKGAEDLGFDVRLGDLNKLDGVGGDVAFSVHYPIRLDTRVLAAYGKAYNLHPGFLPYGRGYFPVFWALWERTPAGATLHEMTSDLDGGPIVAQRGVAVLDHHTGYSLHQEVRAAERELFATYWPRIVRGDFPDAHAQSGSGTYHRKREFIELRDHPPLHQMSGRDVVRLARAFTFPGYPGLAIELGTVRYELALRSIALDTIDRRQE